MATELLRRPGKKSRKWGRNRRFCEHYRLANRREHNKALRLLKHLKRFPSDHGAENVLRGLPMLCQMAAKKKITEVDHLSLSPDGEIDKATNRGRPISNAEKRVEKKYWRSILHWHTHTYHKLLTDVMKENAKWVMLEMKDNPDSKGKVNSPSEGATTSKTEIELLKDQSLQ